VIIRCLPTLEHLQRVCGDAEAAPFAYPLSGILATNRQEPGDSENPARVMANRKISGSSLVRPTSLL